MSCWKEKIRMASKKIDRLKKAGAEMDKFFSGVTEEAQEAPQTAPEKEVKTSTRASRKKPTESHTEPQKEKKKVFSFRAGESQVDSWRVWADAKGIKVDELGEKAISEYIKKHSLTADQQQIYDLKMAQKKS